MWTKLESIYASQGPTRIVTLLEQLLLLKMRESDDMQDFLSRFTSIVNNLQQMKVDVNGELLTIMMLHSLPESYNNFCCAIKSRDSLPSVDNLMGKIIEESFARERKSEDTSGAMFVKHRQSNSRGSFKNNIRNNNQNSNPNHRSDIKCDFCGKTNHKTSKCFKRKKSLNQKVNAVEDAFLVREITNPSVL